MRSGSVAISSKNGGTGAGWLPGWYARVARRSRRGAIVLVCMMVLLVAVVFLFVFLLAQDIADSSKIMEGISIDGLPVGGLTKSSAKEAVTQRVADPLKEPLVLAYDGHEYFLYPEGIELSIDVDRMVDDAYWKGQGQLMPVRMYRRLFNKPLHVDIPLSLKYDAKTLKAFVGQVAEAVDREPVTATVDMSKGSPRVKHSRNGVKVQQDQLLAAITAALRSKKRTIPVNVETVKPKVSDEDLNPIIVIKQSEHKLYIYDGSSLEDSYAVAVGTPQYPTPNGSFRIVEKKKDPWWYPPKSEWAKDKKPIPPGPGNPLGPYWMGLGGLIGIHSTPDEASLGYSASHGCIRIGEWGARDLFNRVKVGTPVYILP